MLSFRTELENPVVEKDILELEKKIKLFKDGKYDEEKFRSLRLARGVYGQRQPGVQMIRIKIPFGYMTTEQLIKIAEISDEYASSTLHATTRQDIQIHYVSLDRTPELWARLEESNITLREACGNTVRNITASASAGVDPKEPFDVSPYAYAMFKYFLRNPVCQEMGRKFKVAFSSNEEDSAFTLIHDVGLIPKVKVVDGQEVRGFKVMIGGGLGAVPYLAQVAYEFLEEDQLMPYTEALLRVFDRYGERARRQKARFKFLLKDIGLDGVKELVDAEWTALKSKTFKVDTEELTIAQPLDAGIKYPEVTIQDSAKYQAWLDTNVFEQKQKGFYGVYVKLLLGNLTSDEARKFADIVKRHAADDIRITINQGYLLKYVRPEALPSLFYELDQMNLANPGFDSTADITACPGTDTCNLGISSSTGIARELEKVIESEYPDLVYDNQIKIKISGCPNSCGQHGIATIGFHGSSLKSNGLVLPALQVLLGGNVATDGTGFIAEKVIKVPSKRGPQVLRTLLSDYDANGNEGEYFAQYYQRQGKMYFYHLLKPLADTSNLEQDDFIDWGKDKSFEVIKAVGECAGVIIDLVDTLFYECDEKYEWAQEALAQGVYADAIYHAYNIFVNGAKALLLGGKHKTNTQVLVLKHFENTFGADFGFEGENAFRDYVFRLNQNEPTKEFAQTYIQDAADFLKAIKQYRKDQLLGDSKEKEVNHV